MIATYTGVRFRSGRRVCSRREVRSDRRIPIRRTQTDQESRSSTRRDARVRYRGHAGTRNTEAEVRESVAGCGRLLVDGQERRTASDVGETIGACEVAPRLRLAALLVAPRERTQKGAWARRMPKPSSPNSSYIDTAFRHPVDRGSERFLTAGRRIERMSPRDQSRTTRPRL